MGVALVAGQGMGIYGQGHLVPIGAMQHYGYMPAAPLPAQGMEGTPLPMLHMAHPRPGLPMYADYHPGGAYRGPQVCPPTSLFIHSGGLELVDRNFDRHRAPSRRYKLQETLFSAPAANHMGSFVCTVTPHGMFVRGWVSASSLSMLLMRCQ